MLRVLDVFSVFSFRFGEMRRTTAVILVLELIACVAAIAHAASVYRPQHSWYAKKRIGAGAYSDGGVGQIRTKWIPTRPVIAKKFHPAPEPDEEHAVPTKRKQVGCKISCCTPRSG